MKAFKSKILVLLLVMVISCVNCSMYALAAESLETMQVEENGFTNDTLSYAGLYDVNVSIQMKSPAITSASLRVTPRSNEILVEVDTGCNFVAKEVGIRNVYVQEKVWYGWKTIAQASDSEKNTTSCAFSAHCTNATKGETYRVICTHYAIESNGTEHKIDNESETFVYN